jgi:hypothetical protein
MRKACVAVSLVLLSVGVVVCVAHAQGGLSVTARGNGQLLLKDAEGDLGTLEINLHNSNWKYASQTDATAQVAEQAGGGKQFTGTLAVPEVTGAALSFVETLAPTEDGLRVTYELNPSGPIVLNGLQISLLLPTDRFGGQQLTIRGGEGAERRLVLPRTLNPAQWQLGTIQGNALQVGPDETPLLTGKVDKTYGLIVHDLRQWDRNEFEVRLPLVQEDQGKMLSTNDRFSVEITLGPGKIAVTGP